MSFEEIYQIVNIENDMVVFQGTMDECLQRKAELENRYTNNFFELQETFTSKQPKSI